MTTAKAFYVEISRAREPGRSWSPDDAQALKERLEAVTGERLSALEGIGESVRAEHEREHGKDGESVARPRTGGPREGRAPPPAGPGNRAVPVP